MYEPYKMLINNKIKGKAACSGLLKSPWQPHQCLLLSLSTLITTKQKHRLKIKPQ